MADEIQDAPLDLSIRSIREETVPEDITGATTEIDTRKGQEPFPQNQLLTAYPEIFNSNATAQLGGQLEIYENKNSGQLENWRTGELVLGENKDSNKPYSGDYGYIAEPEGIAIGYPNFSYFNTQQYYETAVANLQKMVERLKISNRNKQYLAPQTLNVNPSLQGYRGVEELLYDHFQTQPYPKLSDNYKNYYTKKTRRSETVTGNSGDNQNMLSGLSVNTTGQESLQSQYLIPQLQNPPTVFRGPFEYLPSTSCNENLASSSTNMGIGTFDPNFLNRNKMLVQNNTQISKLNDQFSMDNITERQDNMQPDRMRLSAINQNELLLKEIQTIEYFIMTLDKNASSEVSSIERYVPAYWAFLTSKIVKIKIQRLLLGINDPDCDRILSRINFLEKFPKEFWYPSTNVTTPTYVRQEQKTPKILVKWFQNDKDKRNHNYKKRSRQHRKNDGGFWSIVQPEVSGQLQNLLQTAEACTSNQKETQQQK